MIKTLVIHLLMQKKGIDFNRTLRRFPRVTNNQNKRYINNTYHMLFLETHVLIPFNLYLIFGVLWLNSDKLCFMYGRNSEKEKKINKRINKSTGIMRYRKMNILDRENSFRKHSNTHDLFRCLFYPGEKCIFRKKIPFFGHHHNF